MSEKQALQYKVVLIGESGVGKTSIINRYILNKFDDALPSTLGASFISKTVFFENYNQSIKFEIWDTTGQEKFRSLAKIFYKNASVCIFVYDICNKATFNELKNFWINDVKANGNSNMCNLIYNNN